MVEITEKDVVSFEKDGVIKIKDFIPVNQLEELDRAITPPIARRKLLKKLINLLRSEINSLIFFFETHFL